MGKIIKNGIEYGGTPDGIYVPVESTNIDGYSGTIFDLVKNIYPQHYHRWYTTTDGATQNITDRPTGTTNLSFVLEAFLVRNYTGSSQRYRVICRTSAQGTGVVDTYETVVDREATSLQWCKLIHSRQSGTVSNAMLASGAITAGKLNKSDLVNSGLWTCIASKYLSANTTTADLEVAIPAAYQATTGYEYRLTGGIETTGGSGTEKYFKIQAKKGTAFDTSYSGAYLDALDNSSGAWAGSADYFGLEWRSKNNNDSQTFTMVVSKAGSGNYWNAVGQSGGMHVSYANMFAGGGRTKWADAITGFRIHCNASVTYLAGSHISVEARKCALNF